MHIETMRSAISKVYPGESWKKRVEDMSTSQVVAVYHSFLESGRFLKPVGVKRKTDEFKQMTIFDFGVGG